MACLSTYIIAHCHCLFDRGAQRDQTCCGDLKITDRKSVCKCFVIQPMMHSIFHFLTLLRLIIEMSLGPELHGKTESRHS